MNQIWKMVVKFNRVHWVLGVAFLCTGTPHSAFAENAATEKYLEILNASPLGKSARILASNGFAWIEFCPDNTCEVIRTKNTAQHEQLAVLAVGYFLFTSKYSYLKSWQNDSKNKATFSRNLLSHSVGTCKISESKDRVPCLLQKINENISGELLFVRFDEGQINSKKLNLGKELEQSFTDSTRAEK
jgi:hypothetical protein